MCFFPDIESCREHLAARWQNYTVI
jgi:hypothetical protein